MKLILTILFLYCTQANATIFYVSNTGSDGANGLTTGTAWQTIAKVNLSSFSAGDQILFKAGDSWNERLNVPSSGSVGNVITFGSYGTGAKPIITGLQTLTGFTNVGNIWTATATNAVKKLNTVLVAGTLRAKGRYPNTTYLTLSSYSGSPRITSITGSLTGTPNYTGGQIGVRSSHFTFDVAEITSQSGGTLNFSPGLTYDNTYGGTGYFIQNIESVLDIAGEWCFDSTSKVIKVYSTTSPNVQISVIDTLVHLDNRSYITFDGISFTGANKAAFQLDTTSNITITNCSINYSGAMAISALKSDYTTISNDSIQSSFSNAIYMRQVDPYTPTVNTCNYSSITNNYIKNAGHLAGMGMNQQHRYMGVCVVGLSNTISYNRLDSIGYIGLLFNGQNSIAYRNYIKNFCFVLDDGGGIYTNIGAYFPADYVNGLIIRSNIVLNGIGATIGTSAASIAVCIYLDNAVKNVTVDSNTVSSGLTHAMFLNEADSNTIKNNTAIDSIGHVFTIAGSNGVITNGNTIKRNIFYSKSASKHTFYRLSGTTLGTMDSNYYSRPTIEATQLNRNGTTYSLSGWQSATSQDANSLGTPTGITGSAPLFYYNPTQADSTISITGLYYDIKGNSYNNSVSLTPFTSVILFKSLTEIRVRSLSSFKFYKGSVL